MTKRSWLVVLGLAAVGVPAFGQGGRGGAAAAAAAETPEEGIPVTDATTIARCGSCHQSDAKGNMSRISWERTTPEGWEEALKRMIRLNGLTISPEDARKVVKYLSSSHGLAPEEAKSVMYMPENRMQDETNIPNDDVRRACTTCHAFGRALSWRRSKDDWKLLTNLHVGLYPQADAAFRRPPTPPAGGGGRGGRNGGGAGAAAQAGGPPPDTRDFGDIAVDYLATAAPLHSPEWAAWSAKMRAPKLAGRWLVSGHIPGKGFYTGEMVVEPGAADDEFTTRITLKSVKDGSTLTRNGHGLVYSGYSWRGRSTSTGAKDNAPGSLTSEMRETMWFAPDQSSAEGRWFFGEYQEFGVDVKMERASANPTLVALDTAAIKAGSKAARVHLFGDNFPAQLAATDLDFGAGVTVSRVVSHTAGDAVVELDVAANAVSGKRDVAVARSVLQNALAVYDKIDYIKVTPETSLARLGSDVHPKGYQQYEAVAWNRGADGQNNTPDDVELGPIDATWSVEEFLSMYGDDDKDFVGTLSPTGLFTPALDGPNPKRKFSRNNYGDVWIVATSKTEKDKDGKALSGRSYLVVTVPTYIKWDQPEVSR
jgi:quinohemoprotein amine dehydrogenase